MDALRVESARSFFTQMRSAAGVVAVVTAFVVATAWGFTPLSSIIVWVCLQAANQVMRAALLATWQRRPRDDREVAVWARVYVAHMVVSGAIWGSTMFLFAHPDQPITVALTLCSIYGVSAGSMPGQAYYPPALYGFIVPLYGMTLVRLGLTAQRDYILLGVASLAFAAAMVIFCRGQQRVIDIGYRIRFENQALVESLTEQTRAAEEARRDAELASLAKSQFLAAASHDLRQPLYALGLFSASLGSLDLDAEGQRVVGNIQDSIAAMETLFTGLLDISKLEAGVVRPAIAPVSVDALFDRLSQYALPVAIERGLDLRFRSDDQWVASDIILLEQILGNFISNALRYTERGGILVAARWRRERLSLEVWDTGPGIAAVDRERIFDEFVQLENPERDRSKGLGLGLSIARRSAALLGARVAVASRPGKGSRFAIEQPLAAATATLPIPPRTAGRMPVVHRDPSLPVLIVEDNDDVREALADLCRRWGVEPIAVDSAEAAVALVAGGRRIGALLSDYRLGGGRNGLDLIADVAARHPDPAPLAVLITGDVDPQLMQAAEQRGVPLLVKPLGRDDLRRLLGLA